MNITMLKAGAALFAVSLASLPAYAEPIVLGDLDMDAITAGTVVTANATASATGNPTDARTSVSSIASPVWGQATANGMAFGPTGAGTDGNVTLSIGAHGGGIGGVAFTPNGGLVVTHSSGHIYGGAYGSSLSMFSVAKGYGPGAQAATGGSANGYGVAYTHASQYARGASSYTYIRSDHYGGN